MPVLRKEPVKGPCKVAYVIAHDGVTELAHATVGGETIDSTTNHPYFIVGYGYVDAGNLIEGDIVLLANGEEAKVEKVEIEFLTEPVTVYNFEVKDWHCYFVGEEGVLVHNDSCVNTSGAGNTGGNTNGNSGEGGSGTNRTLITGADWNNYFREKYGYDQVNWKTAYDSPNDIIEMPSRVTDMNPNGLYNYLQAENLNVEPLGQGVNKGIS